ncbi:uncharacterized protein RMCN_3736 [Mycolicibacterium novocastrense]|uniref:Uncharacterized protein n=1 Tax=Mycolicibacterium novocastrense TaxID=59813 RepID=A0ABQ0KM40_MYCNV|nr:uncharacterized protein RMCN_3736 [Mycolicibacterium novocastrense]
MNRVLPLRYNDPSASHDPFPAGFWAPMTETLSFDIFGGLASDGTASIAHPMEAVVQPWTRSRNLVESVESD